jgi:hypothetical protein
MNHRSAYIMEEAVLRMGPYVRVCLIAAMILNHNRKPQNGNTNVYSLYYSSGSTAWVVQRIYIGVAILGLPIVVQNHCGNETNSHIGSHPQDSFFHDIGAAVLHGIFSGDHSSLYVLVLVPLNGPRWHKRILLHISLPFSGYVGRIWLRSILATNATWNRVQGNIWSLRNL